MLGLTKDDNEEIAFVIISLLFSAIDAREMQEWCLSIIENNSTGDIPGYIYDLAEFDGPINSIYKVIGFVPDFYFSKKDKMAIYGIATMRGRDRYEWPVKKEDALEELGRNKKIYQKFRATFPFVNCIIQHNINKE